MRGKDALLSEVRLMEVDDTFIGDRRPVECGRGNGGRKPVVLAVERFGKEVGLMAARVLERVNHQQVAKITACLDSGATVRSDAYPPLNIAGHRCQHLAKITPSEQAGESLHNGAHRHHQSLACRILRQFS